MADRWSDFSDKLELLARIAMAHGLETLVLRKPASLTWLLGARVHVPQTLDVACLDVVIELSGKMPKATVVTNAIEAPRLRDTELAGADVDWQIVPWWQSRDPVLPAGAAVGSDIPAAGTIDVAEQVATVRRVLTKHQQDLLALVCADAATAATEAAQSISPGMTENAAAGVLSSALLGRGLDPIVLMVAGDNRRGEHRHPLPTDGLLGQRAMLVCCARRHGLIASVTRLVAFGELRDDETGQYRALLEVERAFLDASKPGVRLGDAFARGVAAYGPNGFEPEEWRRHHQGGFTGLQPREFPAHHDSNDVVPAGSVLAWNPSAAGWKVEDTAVVEPNGARLLVHDPNWPLIEVGGRLRPGVLVR